MKQVTIKLDDELHKKAKIKAINQGRAFMYYVIELIKKDLGDSESGAENAEIKN